MPKITFSELDPNEKHAQDFIVVKNKNPDGAHFAVIAEQGV